MSNLPNRAQFSIVAAAVLLCPVFAFLMAIAVEILIGVLKDAGVPALLVLVVAGGAWSLFCKLPVRPHHCAGVERERGHAAPLERRGLTDCTQVPDNAGQWSIGVEDGLLTITRCPVA